MALHVTQVVVQWLLVKGLVQEKVWVVDMWSDEAVTPVLAVIHTLLTALLIYCVLVVVALARALRASQTVEVA